jgi:argininosuccinate lyase
MKSQGVPFRTAHTTTGSIVKWAKENNTALNEVPLSKLQSFSSLFEEEIYDYLSFKNALSRRNLTGGTGEESVKEQIRKASKIIKSSKFKL